MDFSKFTANKQNLALVGVFLIGLLIGWLLIGWWLWPVSWINADPWDLRPEFKKEYVKMAADSYALQSDKKSLEKRFAGWPRDDLASVLAELKEELKGEGALALRLDAIKDALGVQVKPTPSPTPTPSQAKGGLLGLLLKLLVIIIALALVGIIVWRLFTRYKKLARKEEVTPGIPREEAELGGQKEQPIATFRSTYTYGDPRYDDSFPIEPEEGRYLGECGVGFSELIGSGDPPKVTAFEVWLFDKNDVRTVTKVIASDYAFRDETLRETLKSRASGGEVIPAQLGKEIELETASLRMKAKIQEMTYGDAELAPQSYFTKFSVQIEIYEKESSAEPSGPDMPPPPEIPDTELPE
ncbi:MAG TPA: hypothetical protein ENG33_07065 [Chloroflexi bacterium]|nr:hypothetical protein [Chloroflexota bacterium]